MHNWKTFRNWCIQNIQSLLVPFSLLPAMVMGWRAPQSCMAGLLWFHIATFVRVAGQMSVNYLLRHITRFQARPRLVSLPGVLSFAFQLMQSVAPQGHQRYTLCASKTLCGASLLEAALSMLVHLHLKNMISSNRIWRIPTKHTAHAQACTDYIRLADFRAQMVNDAQNMLWSWLNVFPTAKILISRCTVFSSRRCMCMHACITPTH